MSESSQPIGFDYLKSYPGILKILEGVLHVKLIILTLLLTYSTPRAQFFCGISIYGFISTATLLALHFYRKTTEFPWFWIECVNAGTMALLLLVSSSLIVAMMTKGYIVTGIIGYVATLVYALDAVDNYNVARASRRDRYVWTTPNAPNDDDNQLP